MWGKNGAAIGPDLYRVSISGNEIMLRLSTRRGTTAIGLTVDQVLELVRTLEEAAAKVGD